MRTFVENRGNFLPLLIVVVVGVLLGSALVALSIAAGAPPIVAGVIALSLLIAAVCAYGCTRQVQQEEVSAIHAEQEQMRLAVDAHVELINAILLGVRGKLDNFQHQQVADLNLLRPGGIRALAALQRITSALDHRLEQLLILMNSGSDAGLARAYAIAVNPLKFPNTCVDTVAGSEMPDLPEKEIEETIETLLSRIKQDTIQRTAIG
jgi:hypothetical protein